VICDSSLKEFIFFFGIVIECKAISRRGHISYEGYRV